MKYIPLISQLHHILLFVLHICCVEHIFSLQVVLALWVFRLYIIQFYTTCLDFIFSPPVLKSFDNDLVINNVCIQFALRVGVLLNLSAFSIYVLTSITIYVTLKLPFSTVASAIAQY